MAKKLSYECDRCGVIVPPRDIIVVEMTWIAWDDDEGAHCANPIKRGELCGRCADRARTVMRESVSAPSEESER